MQYVSNCHQHLTMIHRHIPHMSIDFHLAKCSRISRTVQYVGASAALSLSQLSVCQWYRQPTDFDLQVLYIRTVVVHSTTLPSSSSSSPKKGYTTLLYTAVSFWALSPPPSLSSRHRLLSVSSVLF